MFRLVRAKRCGDDGVIAVLTAVIVAFALIPVTAVALSSYTQSGTKAEVQRAADSGALAGASAIGLLDLGTLPQAALVTDLTTITFPAKNDVFGRACLAAAKAYGQTPQAAHDNSPIGHAFATLNSCRAGFAQDRGLIRCLGQATTVTQNVLSGSVTRITDALTALPLVGQLLLRPLLNALNPQSVLNAQTLLVSLLPALSRNAVALQLDYRVEGPLDAVFDSDGSDVTVRATARRTFKPLLPNLSASLGSSGLSGLQLNPGLAGLIDDAGVALSPVETLAVTQLQLVLGVLKVAVGQTTQDAIKPLVGQVDTLVAGVLNLPLLNQLTGALLGRPLSLNLSGITTDCIPAVEELITDLQNALSINFDGTDRDLIPCLVDQVGLLGRNPLVPATQRCTNSVFRATLVQN